MTDEEKPGLWENVRGRVAAQADALKASAAAALREKAAEIRDAIGPERIEPVTQPERPFGRDEGGEDVKRVVWTGHTVKTSEDKAYFGAVGLTQGGYYRAAEVQVYGADETWRWQAERHTVKEDAISSAQAVSANRLHDEAPKAADEGLKYGSEWNNPQGDGARLSNMAEIPEHVKAQADAEVAKTGAQKMAVQDMNTRTDKGPDWTDTKGLEAQQAQKREDALREKTPEPDKGPDKG
jgi:hypothetical protein